MLNKKYTKTHKLFIHILLPEPPLPPLSRWFIIPLNFHTAFLITNKYLVSKKYIFQMKDLGMLLDSWWE